LHKTRQRITRVDSIEVVTAIRGVCAQAPRRMAVSMTVSSQAPTRNDTVWSVLLEFDRTGVPLVMRPLVYWLRSGPPFAPPASIR
jgi:hypothetical protein